jgi:hypothetical protein
MHRALPQRDFRVSSQKSENRCTFRQKTQLWTIAMVAAVTLVLVAVAVAVAVAVVTVSAFHHYGQGHGRGHDHNDGSIRTAAWR